MQAAERAALEARVADELVRLAPSGHGCVVAVSGGPDSVALLELLWRGAGRHGRALTVVHVDHGINPESDVPARLVAALAVERALDFRLVQLTLGPGASETRARSARRAALRQVASEVGADAIVLAHHADDQAETVLLRLLRGSGPAGLAGMAGRHGPWVRPLLNIRRSELAAYAEAGGLPAWIDPANSDPRHLRSWLRSTVFPVVQARLPDVVGRLRRAGAQAAAGRSAWSQVLHLLPGLDTRTGNGGISVAAPVLQGYRSALRHAVLAALGRQRGILLGARRLAALDRLLVGRSGGGSVSLGRRSRAELAFGRLTFYQVEAAIGDAIVLGPGEAALDGSRFAVKVDAARSATRGGWSNEFVPGRYVVRRWRAGDRIRPLGGSGSRAVAVLLREARIPPARRSSWPVVVNADDATIVWVPGICRADAGVPAKGSEAWRVECAIA